MDIPQSDGTPGRCRGDLALASNVQSSGHELVPRTILHLAGCHGLCSSLPTLLDKGHHLVMVFLYSNCEVDHGLSRGRGDLRKSGWS